MVYAQIYFVWIFLQKLLPRVNRRKQAIYFLAFFAEQWLEVERKNILAQHHHIDDFVDGGFLMAMVALMSWVDGRSDVHFAQWSVLLRVGCWPRLDDIDQGSAILLQRDQNGDYEQFEMVGLEGILSEFSISMID